MGLTRTVSGFFQISLIIYFPVWVDTFGGANKTLWLSYIQLAVVLGVVLGYIITALFNIANEKYSSVSWRWAFYMQFLVLLVAAGIINSVPEEELATNGIYSYSKKQQKDNFEKFPVLKMSVRFPSMVFNGSVDLEGQEISDIDIDTTQTNPLEENLIEQEQSIKGIIETGKIIFHKHLFILTMLTLCSLYFIITAI